MLTSGRTDITKIIFAFRNFPNSPKNEYNDFSLVTYDIKTNNLVEERLYLVDNRGSADHTLKLSSNA